MRRSHLLWGARYGGPQWRRSVTKGFNPNRRGPVVEGFGSLFVLVVVFVGAVITAAPGLLPDVSGFVTVPDDDMSPLYESGDVLLLREAETYRPGDVIAFETLSGGADVARVVEHTAFGWYWLSTDPDDGGDSLAETTTDDAVLGVVAARLPGPLGFLASLVGVVPSVLLGAALGACFVAWSPARLRARRLAMLGAAYIDGDLDEIHPGPLRRLAVQRPADRPADRPAEYVAASRGVGTPSGEGADEPGPAAAEPGASDLGDSLPQPFVIVPEYRVSERRPVRDRVGTSGEVDPADAELVQDQVETTTEEVDPADGELVQDQVETTTGEVDPADGELVQDQVETTTGEVDPADGELVEDQVGTTTGEVDPAVAELVLDQVERTTEEVDPAVAELEEEPTAGLDATASPGSDRPATEGTGAEDRPAPVDDDDERAGGETEWSGETGRRRIWWIMDEDVRALRDGVPGLGETASIDEVEGAGVEVVDPEVDDGDESATVEGVVAAAAARDGDVVVVVGDQASGDVDDMVAELDDDGVADGADAPPDADDAAVGEDEDEALVTDEDSVDLGTWPVTVEADGSDGGETARSEPDGVVTVPVGQRGWRIVGDDGSVIEYDTVDVVDGSVTRGEESTARVVTGDGLQDESVGAAGSVSTDDPDQRRDVPGADDPRGAMADGDAADVAVDAGPVHDGVSHHGAGSGDGGVVSGLPMVEGEPLTSLPHRVAVGIVATTLVAAVFVAVRTLDLWTAAADDPLRSMSGLATPLWVARAASTVMLVALIGVCAYTVWRGFLRTPWDRFQARFWRLVDEVDPRASQSGPHVLVKDLAVLPAIARRVDGRIGHQVFLDGVHRYFVVTDDVVYEHALLPDGTSHALQREDVPLAIVEVSSVEALEHASLAGEGEVGIERREEGPTERLSIVVGDLMLVHEAPVDEVDHTREARDVTV